MSGPINVSIVKLGKRINSPTYGEIDEKLLKIVGTPILMLAKSKQLSKFILKIVYQTSTKHTNTNKKKSLTRLARLKIINKILFTLMKLDMFMYKQTKWS